MYHGLFNIRHERIYQYVLADKSPVANCIFIYDVTRKDTASDMVVLIEPMVLKIEYLLMMGLRLPIKNYDLEIGRLIQS